MRAGRQASGPFLLYRGGMNKRLKSAILGMVLAFSGCSARTMGVKYADRLAMHQLDEMFDLTSDQEDAFGPLVKSEIARLKKERLPQVVDKVDDYAKAWDRGPKEADAMAVVDEYDALRADLANQLGPLAAKFLAGLSKDQIGHLEEELAESNENTDDLLAKPPEDFTKTQSRGLIKNYEHWLGSVSDEQEVKLLALAPPDRAEFERYRTERLASQKAFLDLLKANPGEAAIQAKIVEWTKDPYKMRGTTPEQGQRRRQKLIRILTETHAIATAEQRQHAKDEMSSLTSDLRAALR